MASMADATTAAASGRDRRERERERERERRAEGVSGQGHVSGGHLASRSGGRAGGLA
jgi:hypothetical protein